MHRPTPAGDNSPERRTPRWCFAPKAADQLAQRLSSLPTRRSAGGERGAGAEVLTSAAREPAHEAQPAEVVQRTAVDDRQRHPTGAVVEDVLLLPLVAVVLLL